MSSKVQPINTKNRTVLFSEKPYINARDIKRATNRTNRKKMYENNGRFKFIHSKRPGRCLLPPLEISNCRNQKSEKASHYQQHLPESLHLHPPQSASVCSASVDVVSAFPLRFEAPPRLTAILRSLKKKCNFFYHLVYSLSFQR